MADHWDHWQYYSIIGVIALVVAAGEEIYRQVGEPVRSVGVVASAAVWLLVAAGCRRWNWSSVYTNEEALWIDNVAKNPSPGWPTTTSGSLCARWAGCPEGIGQYEQALWIVPDNAKVHFNLGVALGRVGQSQAAISHYEQALQSNLGFTEAHVNLGIALSQIGSNREGLCAFHGGATTDSRFSRSADAIWEMALFHAGRIAEAVEHFGQALRIEPDYVDAHFDLGLALEKLKDGRRKPLGNTNKF